MTKLGNRFLNRSLHKLNFPRVIKFDKLLSGRHLITPRLEAFSQADASLRIKNFTPDGADENFFLLMFFLSGEPTIPWKHVNCSSEAKVVIFDSQRFFLGKFNEEPAIKIILCTVFLIILSNLAFPIPIRAISPTSIMFICKYDSLCVYLSSPLSPYRYANIVKSLWIINSFL